MTTETLDVLLIEDNSGDARLVEEMLREARDELHRIDTNGSTLKQAVVHHEMELAAGIEHFQQNEVDIILLDLGLPDSAGMDTLISIVEETAFTPVIVLTGLDDRELGIQAIQRGAEDYLVKDEVTGELLVHAIQYAMERASQEREQVRYREQLEALNRLNTITQEITHDVITTSSREDLEQAVCDRLVESDAYRYAWIGGVSTPTDELTPRVTAGGVEAPEKIVIDVSEEANTSSPEATAVQTRSVQDVQDAQPETGCELEGLGDSYRSLAAIPLSYRAVFYGILVVYAESPNAFSGREREILARLGDVIGHAITAIERKNALVSDTALELEFRVDTVAQDLLALTADYDGIIECDTLIRSAENLLVYGSAAGLPRDAFEEAAEQTPEVENLRILGGERRQFDFEFVTGAVNRLDEALATHGGHMCSARIDCGELRFVTEFPQGRDKHQLVELVENNCEAASLQAHRTVERNEPDVPDSRSVLQDRLTEKQRAALETAYHAGYFNWPRTTSGDEIAERLGITQATFSQHFRAAEREFFEAIFQRQEEPAPESSPWQSSETDAADD